MPNNSTVSKKLVLIIFILGAAIVAAGVFWYKSPHRDKPASPVVNSAPAPSQVENVTVKSSPAAGAVPLLPADFPIEKGAKIMNNFSAASESQTTPQQFTRTFVTTRSLDSNLTLYRNYLLKNKWVMQAPIVTSSYKVLAASKDDLAILITMQQQKTVRTVTITVTKNLDDNDQK